MDAGQAASSPTQSICNLNVPFSGRELPEQDPYISPQHAGLAEGLTSADVLLGCEGAGPEAPVPEEGDGDGDATAEVEQSSGSFDSAPGHGRPFQYNSAAGHVDLEQWTRAPHGPPLLQTKRSLDCDAQFINHFNRLLGFVKRSQSTPHLIHNWTLHPDMNSFALQLGAL